MAKIAKLLPALALAFLLLNVSNAIGQTTPAQDQTADGKTPPAQAQRPDNSSNNQTSPAASAGAAKAKNKDGDDSAGSFDKNDQDDADKESKPHRNHIHLGTIGIGVSYTRFSGNFFPYYGYGFYPYGGFYSPLAYGFYDPFYDPFYPGSLPLTFDYSPYKGEVKLTSSKGAVVYLNGGFAGPADKLKSMWLEPGAYDLAVSGANGEKFQQRIYVISGKSLKIQAKLVAQKNSRQEEKQ